MRLNPVNLTLGKRLPRPQLGINMWSQGAKAKVIRQVVDAYGNVDNQTFFFNFDGVIQPLRPEEIKVKEEAQWSWDWYWFHTLQDIQLTTHDRVF